jgi:hypothetical protein
MFDIFWIDSIVDNISKFIYINLNTEKSFNNMLQIIFGIFLILLLIDSKYCYIFLLISLLFIIVIYYFRKNKMYKCNEKFEFSNLSTSENKNINGKVYRQTSIQTPEPIPFCNDYISIEPQTPVTYGLNQRLAGTANPKTNIAPVVLPPIYDLEYWKDNNMIQFSAINTKGVQEDMYLSGYAESTCCDYLPQGTTISPSENNIKKETTVGGRTIENYQIVSPTPVEDIPDIIGKRRKVIEGYSNINSPTPVEDIPDIIGHRRKVIEGYAEFETIENPKKVKVIGNQSGWVNTSCGYNPEQVYKSSLPSNYSAGNCEQDPSLKQYNENLFTQTITPGVYTRSQINEPINSNIGISFQQQFEPVTCHNDDKGLHYLQHDPRIIEPAILRPKPVDQATYDNVYDPRFYGYGTSYRSYNEPVTGQTRFMYDDINSIRMPNYITRSKIDHLPYADKYGPMEEGSEFGNVHNPHIKYLAQDSWLRDSLEFRNDLSERRMRKINSEAWQKRQSPLGPRRV